MNKNEYALNTPQRYRRNRNRSMFEDEERNEKLSNLGNPLKALEELIDFEMFRPVRQEPVAPFIGVIRVI